MGKNTGIAWCDHTANFWGGCTKVSPGCLNCYAEWETPIRVNGVKWGRGESRILFKSAKADVKRWNEQAKAAKAKMDGETAGPLVFWNSLSDWLDTSVDSQWRTDLLNCIRLAPHCRHMLLTKRPEMFFAALEESLMDAEEMEDGEKLAMWLDDWICGNPPGNVALGVSAENQQYAAQRVPRLLDWPAKARFLSLEPLLGEIRLEECGAPLSKLSQVIVGGESGALARPCDIVWIQRIIQDCRQLDIPCFVKQLGANPRWADQILALKHRKGGDPEEWRECLRIRQPIRFK